MIVYRLRWLAVPPLNWLFRFCILLNLSYGQNIVFVEARYEHE